MFLKLISGAFICSCIYILNLHLEIKNLKIDVLEAQNELVHQKRQSNLYRLSLEKQSKQIELLKVNTKLANSKLEKWKKQPKKIKYKVIYKKGEIKSNDCKDIKSVIDNIRNLNYDSL